MLRYRFSHSIVNRVKSFARLGSIGRDIDDDVELDLLRRIFLRECTTGRGSAFLDGFETRPQLRSGRSTAFLHRYSLSFSTESETISPGFIRFAEASLSRRILADSGRRRDRNPHSPRASRRGRSPGNGLFRQDLVDELRDRLGLLFSLLHVASIVALFVSLVLLREPFTATYVESLHGCAVLPLSRFLSGSFSSSCMFLSLSLAIPPKVRIRPLARGRLEGLRRRRG